MDTDISDIVDALNNNQIQVVNEFLKEKWEQDVNLFIESVSRLRDINAPLIDKHFNSGEFLQQFARH
ncbi:MAG: hypothetical protein OEV78_04750 [Spirochaetia bacterium]|nr:hypothetical protein [Spirochaetia bacterium]